MANTLPGKANSVWLDTTPATHFPVLPENLSVDVAVLGGGITGLTAALFLAEAGREVAVVEASRIVTGVTGFTTAKVTSNHNIVYSKLASHFGEENARLYGQANQWALEHIAEWVKQMDIRCDFIRDDAYTYASTKEEQKIVQEEAEVAAKLGLPASYVEEVPLPFKTYGAVKFTDQARFHPRKYLLALSKQLTAKGGKIFEETRATQIKEGRDDCTIETEHGTFKAKYVIVATHFPFYDNIFLYARMAPRRSYVLAVRAKGELPDGMFIGTGEEHFSLRRVPYEGTDLLIVGGMSHKTGHGGDTRERYLKLEEWARSHFRVESVEYHWSTQDNSPVDGLPFIGTATPSSKRVFLGTGYDGWGMTNGTVAGKLMSDLITNTENAWVKLFNPHRFDPLVAGPRAIKENTSNIAKLLLDRLHRAPKKELEAIKVGEGKIIQVGKEKLAVSRNEQGELHAVSPICTHMGCTVRWNSAEQSWDCPCHGSRFDNEGGVLHGPAVTALAEQDLQAQ